MILGYKVDHKGDLCNNQKAEVKGPHSPLSPKVCLGQELLPITHIVIESSSGVWLQPD